MSLIEWIATISGVLCVYLYTRENVWSWPTGLIQTVLLIYVFYEAKLYADFGLWVIYVPLQIYGWWKWHHRNPHEPDLAITRMNSTHLTAWIVGGAGATFVLGHILHRYTDAAYAYWDSAISIYSLIAQYLIARKVLENWILWIAVDLVAIPVYLLKALYPTSALFAIFLVLSILGYLQWRKTYLAQLAASSSENSFPLIEVTSSSSTSPETTATT